MVEELEQFQKFDCENQKVGKLKQAYWIGRFDCQYKVDMKDVKQHLVHEWFPEKKYEKPTTPDELDVVMLKVAEYRFSSSGISSQ